MGDAVEQRARQWLSVQPAPGVGEGYVVATLLDVLDDLRACDAELRVCDLDGRRELQAVARAVRAELVRRLDAVGAGR